MNYLKHLHHGGWGWHFHCNKCGEHQHVIDEDSLVFLNYGMHNSTTYKDDKECESCKLPKTKYHIPRQSCGDIKEG